MKKNDICQQAKNDVNPKLVIAAFDFDGTITTRDSLPLFFIFETGFLNTALKLVLHIPLFTLCLLRVVSRQKVKESLLTHFFKGVSIDHLKSQGELFVEKSLPKILKQEALDKILWHKAQGHICLLVSANLDVYLDSFAKKYQLDGCLCSKVDFDQKGKVTGKLQGLNCYGKEKVNKLKKEFGKKENYLLYAYGDSKGDRELLEFADYPFYREF